MMMMALNDTLYYSRDETTLVYYLFYFVCGSSKRRPSRVQRGCRRRLGRCRRGGSPVGPCVRFAYTSLPPPSYTLHYNIRDRYRDLKIYMYININIEKKKHFPLRRSDFKGRAGRRGRAVWSARGSRVRVILY